MPWDLVLFGQRDGLRPINTIRGVWTFEVQVGGLYSCLHIDPAKLNLWSGKEEAQSHTTVLHLPLWEAQCWLTT